MKAINILVFGLLASTAIYAPAYSQDAQPSASPAGAESSGRDTISPNEILVTARRRDEKLQDVPISITALSSGAITSQGVVSQSDLQRVVPGLTVRTAQDRNYFNYSIRGQTLDSYSGSFPGVLAYVNDVQVTAISRSTFYDIESIQVLKGPQGTLFGRNTTGGAVLISTASPKDEFEGYIRASHGKYNLRELEGALNLPLTNAISVRVAGDIRRRNGYARNLATGGRINNDHSDNLRGTILIEPGTRFKNTLVVEYAHSEESSGNILYDVVPCAKGGFVACLYGPANTGGFGFPPYSAVVGANPSLPAGGLEQRFAERANMRYWDTYLDVPTNGRSKNLVVTNNTTIELSDSLKLKNVIGYSKQILRQMYDTDATDLPIFGYIPPLSSIGSDVPLTDSKQFSEEIQLQGNTQDNKLNWIVGGIFSKSKTVQSDLFTVFAFPPLFGGFTTHGYNQTEDISTGIFAQATWDASSIIDGLSLTGGFRWTKAKIKLRKLASPFSIPSATLSKTEQKPSWTVSIDYKASPEVLLYITNRGSWRTGGFNSYSTLELAPFDPETIVDIEAGMKSEHRFGDVRALLNVAVYNQWVHGTQRNVPVLVNAASGAITLNAPGGSRVRGMELSASLSPTTWATFGVNYAYTHATYPRPNVNILGVASKLGPYADTPKHTAAIYTQFEFPIGGNDQVLRLRGDYYVQSKTYFSNFGATTQPGSLIPSYNLVNFHAEIENVGVRGMSLGFTMKNAFNEEYASGGIPTGGTLGFETAVPGEPQTFWFDVKYKF